MRRSLVSCSRVSLRRALLPSLALVAATACGGSKDSLEPTRPSFATTTAASTGSRDLVWVAPSSVVTDPLSNLGLYRFGQDAPVLVNTAASATFIVQNNGDRATSVLLVEFSAGGAFYSLTSNTCSGVSLGKGKTCSVSVQFAPTSTATQIAALRISSKKPDAVAGISFSTPIIQPYTVSGTVQQCTPGCAPGAGASLNLFALDPSGNLVSPAVASTTAASDGTYSLSTSTPGNYRAVATASVTCTLAPSTCNIASGVLPLGPSTPTATFSPTLTPQ
ncbi:MAG TPA: hypothetical protein VLI43_11670 [Gemmatimonadaceae bacterium]|jgi:hypothetical protein|nr:hypothetical protein [Gemmatimonadaceae bacterium]